MIKRYALKCGYLRVDKIVLLIVKRSIIDWHQLHGNPCRARLFKEISEQDRNSVIASKLGVGVAILKADTDFF